MTAPIGTLLLIDDDEADNYLHRRVIERSGLCESVIVQTSAGAALDWLRSSVGDRHPAPDLIFLDINMPGMNGWEFLEEYETLPRCQQGRIVLVMLTASINPTDAERVAEFTTVTGHRSKPLTEQMLLAIVEEHFAS